MNGITSQEKGNSPAFDTTRRYVRILAERPNGLVEFAFSIGEPDVSVDMILTREALDEFIANTSAELLPPATDRS